MLHGWLDGGGGDERVAPCAAVDVDEPCGFGGRKVRDLAWLRNIWRISGAEGVDVEGLEGVGLRFIGNLDFAIHYCRGRACGGQGLP